MGRGAAFAKESGTLAHDPAGIRESLDGFIAMKGKLEMKITRVLEACGLAMVATTWTFAGPSPDGKPVNLAGQSADPCAASPAARGAS